MIPSIPKMMLAGGSSLSASILTKGTFTMALALIGMWTVVLSLIVDETGHPQQISLVTTLGFALDQKAIEAVQKWRFTPGMKDGKPVPARVGVLIDFRLP